MNLVGTTLKWMLESTMKRMLESTLIKVENLKQSEVRIQAASSTIIFSINAAINPITKLKKMLNLVCICLKVESA